MISLTALALAVAWLAVLSPLTSAAPVARGSAAPVAKVVNPKPPIKPRKGKSFIPVQGDWEGTDNGFPASFELRYDASLPDHAGIPKYGISQLVTLRPAGCPVAASSYRETLVTGQVPSEISRYGSLGLQAFGFGGSFTAASKAVLSGAYSERSCSGKQVWHMHPATRAPVDDGTWKVKFRDGETGTFDVLAGGRLATRFVLPDWLHSCNGVSGGVDLFIGSRGRAQVSQPTVDVSARFSRRTASGQVNAPGRGCAHGALRFTASVR